MRGSRIPKGRWLGLPLKSAEPVLQKKEEGLRDRCFAVLRVGWGHWQQWEGCEPCPPVLTPEPLKLAEVGTLQERSLSLGLRLLAMTLAVGPAGSSWLLCQEVLLAAVGGWDSAERKLLSCLQTAANRIPPVRVLSLGQVLTPRPGNRLNFTLHSSAAAICRLLVEKARLGAWGTQRAQSGVTYHGNKWC